MADKIKLDIVSDIACPWCIIGYKRLEKAITELGIEECIDLEWQPFEINPDLPATGPDLREHFAKKYGSSLEEGERFRDRISALGAEIGFEFDFFAGMRSLNTRDAHVLLDYAKESGLQTELQMRLFEGYFSEQKDISDRQVLGSEVLRVGLNSDEALARLDDTSAQKRVQDQEAHWHSLGVSSVPTVIINHSKAVTGAQPVDVYKQLLAELVEPL
ncbi:DsbA family oxidoreductase [Trichlorobacter lovleyi]|jgi:predicted DsbA family dithiol-disulfide isomerase|uniref:DsbA family oxidoreductase n=1 Tax=Trichlorobacter lovleyi TaxID=313985 RepID=UPI003D0D3E4F